MIACHLDVLDPTTLWSIPPLLFGSSACLKQTLSQEDKGLNFIEEPVLSLDNMQQLCDELGFGSGRCVTWLYQKHSEMVHVPPGYIHCVRNLVSCVKLAWDFYTPSKYGSCIQAMGSADGRYSGKHNAPDYYDYMAVESMVLDVASRSAVQWERFLYAQSHEKLRSKSFIA